MRPNFNKITLFPEENSAGQLKEAIKHMKPMKI